MRSILIALVLLAVPTIAAAESRAQECQPGQDCTDLGSFDDEEVDGTRQSGGLDRYSVHRNGVRVSLLNIRRHFIPEMVKSVEDI